MSSDGPPAHNRATVLIAAHPRGHVVIGQPAHGWMCGQLGRAWGNERFGPVEPAEEVCLAAEQHDTTWARGRPRRRSIRRPASRTPTRASRSRSTSTCTRSGRAASCRRAATRRSSSRSTTARSSRRPAGLGRAARGRAADRGVPRAGGGVPGGSPPDAGRTDAEIERNWRLVRTWDGLSHDLILDQVPRTRTVPAGGRRTWRSRSTGAATAFDGRPVAVRRRRGRRPHRGAAARGDVRRRGALRTRAGARAVGHARVRATSRLAGRDDLAATRTPHALA